MLKNEVQAVPADGDAADEYSLMLLDGIGEHHCGFIDEPSTQTKGETVKDETEAAEPKEEYLLEDVMTEERFWDEDYGMTSTLEQESDDDVMSDNDWNSEELVATNSATTTATSQV